MFVGTGVIVQTSNADKKIQAASVASPSAKTYTPAEIEAATQKSVALTAALMAKNPMTGASSFKGYASASEAAQDQQNMVSHLQSFSDTTKAIKDIINDPDMLAVVTRSMTSDQKDRFMKFGEDIIKSDNAGAASVSSLASQRFTVSGTMVSKDTDGDFTIGSAFALSYKTNTYTLRTGSNGQTQIAHGSEGFVAYSVADETERAKYGLSSTVKTSVNVHA